MDVLCCRSDICGDVYVCGDNSMQGRLYLLKAGGMLELHKAFVDTAAKEDPGLTRGA